MAEFCRECFINHLKPSAEEIPNIVMSEDNDFCEGCGQIKPVVLYIMERKEKSNA